MAFGHGERERVQKQLKKGTLRHSSTSGKASPLLPVPKGDHSPAAGSSRLTDEAARTYRSSGMVKVTRWDCDDTLRAALGVSLGGADLGVGGRTARRLITGVSWGLLRRGLSVPSLCSVSSRGTPTSAALFRARRRAARLAASCGSRFMVATWYGMDAGSFRSSSSAGSPSDAGRASASFLNTFLILGACGWPVGVHGAEAARAGDGEGTCGRDRAGESEVLAGSDAGVAASALEAD